MFFSFAILLWEIVTRKEPYYKIPPFQIVYAVGTDKARPDIPSDCPKEFRLAIEQCWSENPSDRPSFEDLLLYNEKLLHQINK